MLNFVVFNLIKVTLLKEVYRVFLMFYYTTLQNIAINGAFCLNTFPMTHLQNTSPYQIIYGCDPPALSEIQSASHDLTNPNSFHFSDHLTFLEDHFTKIRQIVRITTIKLYNPDIFPMDLLHPP